MRQAGLIAGVLLLGVQLLTGCTPDQPPTTTQPMANANGNAWLGVEVFASETELVEPCVQVLLVLPDAPGARAGLREGDKIMTVGGQAVSYNNDIVTATRRQKAGFALSVMRDGQRLELTVPYEKAPSNEAIAARFSALHKQRYEEDFQNAEAAERAGDKAAAFRGYANAVRVARAAGANYTDPLKRLAAVTSTLRPPPAVPVEAQRLNQRAMTRVQNADNHLENLKATDDFSGAIYVAPWVGDLHVNYALLLERMGSAEEAATELRYYLVLNDKAPDADQVRQKLYALTSLADELKPWRAFMGRHVTSSGKTYVVGFRGREMAVMVGNQTVCSGRIESSSFRGKCFFTFDADDAKRCFGPKREYEAVGHIEGNSLHIESVTSLNYNASTCVINSETKGTMLRLNRSTS